MIKRCGKTYYEYEYTTDWGEGDGEMTYTVIKDMHAASKEAFFDKVAKEIAMDDCTGIHVTKIVFRGKGYKYVGWQPGMLYEFRRHDDVQKVWLPEYDH